jgi:hypothetical protein
VADSNQVEKKTNYSSWDRILRINKKIIFAILLIFIVGGASFSVYYYTEQQAIPSQLSTIGLTPDWEYSTISNDVWITPIIRPEGFLFEVQVMGYGSFTFDVVNRSIVKYKLGESTKHHPVGGEIGEWGYSFQNLFNGALDGSGRAHYGGYPTPPVSRAEALEVIHQYLLNLTDEDPRPWCAFNGHYPYHHYAADWGYDVIGSEIGENINGYQMRLSFNRGAARQYNIPWFIDVSAWYSGGITDYSTLKPWGAASGPNNGHSLSLYRRTYYTSYMAGTGALVAEAGGVNFFLEEQDGEGLFIPSPLGLIGQELYNFTQIHADPGVPYTPFAFLLDYYHGTYSGLTEKKTFDYFPYNRGDELTWNWLDTFFPDSWQIDGEVGALTHSPFGDTCDVILQNASTQVLSSYPIIIPTGDITFSTADINRIFDYVNNSGILLLNTAYINQFKSTSIGNINSFDLFSTTSIGAGYVITYGPNFNMELIGKWIMNELADIYLPFKISGGDVQYLINRRSDSWILTLINNDGVTKDPRSPPIIDATKEKVVNIKFQGAESILTINDWLIGSLSNSTWIQTSSDTVSVTIPPGEIAVLEFQ